MKARPVVPRERARADVEAALDHYLEQGGEAVALEFLEALDRAFAHVARYPASGSPRYALELNLPGLRSWRLSPHPYLVFYLERAGYIDVWRVLHARRDIPERIEDEGSEAPPTA